MDVYGKTSLSLVGWLEIYQKVVIPSLQSHSKAQELQKFKQALEYGTEQWDEDGCVHTTESQSSASTLLEAFGTGRCEILDDLKAEIILHKQARQTYDDPLLQTRAIVNSLRQELNSWKTETDSSINLEAFLCILKAAAVQSQDGREEKMFLNLTQSCANAINGWSRKYGALNWHGDEIEKRYEVLDKLLAGWISNVNSVAGELDFDWSAEDDTMTNRAVYNCTEVLRQLTGYHKELNSFETFAMLFPEFFRNMKSDERSDCMQHLHSALCAKEEMEWETFVKHQSRVKEILEESTFSVLRDLLSSESYNNIASLCKGCNELHRCRVRNQSIINAMEGLVSWTMIQSLKNNAQRSVLHKFGTDLTDVQHQLQITDTFSEKGPKLRFDFPKKVFQRRLLFQQLKRSYIAVTKTDNTSINTDYITQNQQKYIAVAKYMRNVESAFHTAWCKRTAAEVNCLLCIETLTPNSALDSENLMIANVPSYVSVSQEARMFLGMQFNIPKACSILLQQEQILFQRWRTLQNLHQDLQNNSQFSDVEKELLNKDCMTLHKRLRSLCRRATWSTLSFNESANQFAQELTAFKALVHNVRSISFILEEKLRKVEPLPGISDEMPENELTSVQNFVSKMKCQADKFYERLSEVLDSLRAPLLQLENMIVNHSAGHRKQLESFYLLWEGKVYGILVNFVSESMRQLQEILKRPVPSFELETKLVVPYVTTNPSLPDLYSLFNSIAKHWIKKSQCLKRWKRNSCVPFEDNYTYTYLDDLLYEPTIKSLSQEIQSLVKQTLHKVKAELTKWRVFVKIWRREKELNRVDLPSDGSLPITILCNGLEYYDHLTELFVNLLRPSAIGFFRLNNANLSVNISGYVQEWMRKFADSWLHIVREMIENFNYTTELATNEVQDAESDFEYITAIITSLQLYGLEVPWLVKDKYAQLQFALEKSYSLFTR